MPQTIIFAGISITAADVAAMRPHAKIMPPARRGDVLRATKDGFQQICLLDGMMIYHYPPSPSEVAAALESGVHVVAGCSIGALRAVELRKHPLMKGFGWVYRAVLEGRLLGDDELVARLDPLSGRPISLFVANVLYACELLRSECLLSAAQADLILTGLRQVHFDERTPALLRQLVRGAGLSGSVAELIFSPSMDIKRADALICLDALRP